MTRDPSRIPMLAAVLLAVFFAADLGLLIFFLTRTGNPPRPTAPKAPTVSGRYSWMFPVGFGLVWSAMVLSVDHVAIRSVVRQLSASGYSQTDGVIRKCSMIENSDGEGTSYDIDIEYTYSISNKQYVGKHVRYYKLWDRSWVSQFVETHQPQSKVTVYYDPANPQESVLIRETDGGPLWLAMFLVPFNLGMVMFAVAGFNSALRLQPPAPFAIFEHEDTRIYRLRLMSPIVASALCLLASCLVVGVCFAICCGMSPSILGIAIAWAVVLAGTALTYFRVAHLTATGYYDLIVDPGKQMMTLPRIRVKTEDNIPFAAVASIDIEAVAGDEGESKYAASIRWRAADNQVRQEKLFESSDREVVEQFAAALRQDVELPS